MGKNKLLKMFPRSFTRAGRNILNNLGKDQRKIDYDDFSYKIPFSDEDSVRVHETSFFKNKYGTLYDLLKDLITSEIKIRDANIDQVSLITRLMMDMTKMIHKSKVLGEKG